MRHPVVRSIRLGWAFALLLAGCMLTQEEAQAQVPALLPIPYETIAGGLAPGASGAVCASGYIPTFYGSSNYGDGCLATQATFSTPYSSFVDSLGNVYITDYGHRMLRVIYNKGAALAAAIVASNATVSNLVPQAGYIYNLAGSHTGVLSTSGSPAKYYCNGLGTGTIALSSNGDGCPGTEVYAGPRSSIVDKDGNVIFTSGAGGAPVRIFYVGGTAAANLITVLNPGVTPQVGYVYSLVKSASNGYQGDGQLATNSTVALQSVRSVAVDSNENLYISDGYYNSTSNNNIRFVNGTTGIISTFAGSPGCATQITGTGCTGSYSGDGGAATAATFNTPYDIFLDAYNNVYIADYVNARLRVIYEGGTVPGLSNLTVGNIYTVAGGGTQTTSGNPATSLSFGTVYVAGIDTVGNLYVVDGTSRLVWQINAKTGIGVIYAGGHSSFTVGTHCNGLTTGPTALDTLGDGCPSTQTSINASGHLAFDIYNNMYETESTYAAVRKSVFNTQFPATALGSNVTQQLAYEVITPTTLTVTSFTLGGNTTSEFTDVSGSDTCAMNTALAAKAVCVFYVNFAPAAVGVRKGTNSLLASGSTLTTLNLSGVGQAALASLDPASVTTQGSGMTPTGVGFDLLGNLFVADKSSNSVFELSSGNKTTWTSGLSNPAQIALDGGGNVYVADSGNNRVAAVATAGGTITAYGSGLLSPHGVATDGQGNLYISDTGNNRIVWVNAIGAQFTLPISGLSSPEGIALDNSGDLFIADTGNSRVVEYSAAGVQSAVNLGSSMITPTGVAVDAAGGIYVADAASLQVLAFAPGSTNPDALVTGLLSPNGIALDGNNDIAISDAQAGGVLLANRATPTITYPKTNINQSNSSPLSVANTGNTPLSFSSALLTSATGNTADFAVSSASVNGCTYGTAVPAGVNCMLTATFQPIVVGSLSETVSLLSNASNGASVAATLTGPGVNLITTTTAVAITSPSSAPYSYGQTIVLTTTVSASKNGGAVPTGTVVFNVDGKAQPAVTLPANGVVTLSLNPSVATHSVTATYSGDNIYASSSMVFPFTVVKATTATALTLTTIAQGSAPAITLSAAVTSPTASGETGTVSFYSGTTLLATQAVSAGTAKYTTSTILYSSYNFSAVYSGDTNFSGSTSATLQQTGDYIAISSSSTAAIAQGGVATVAFNVTPLYNYIGTLTASCGNLPGSTICRFQPASLSLSGTTTQTLSMLIYTDVDSTLAQNQGAHPFREEGVPVLAFSLLGLSAILAGMGSTRSKGLLGRLLLLAMAGGLAAMSGCSHSATPTVYKTPIGSQTITVSFTDTYNLAHSVSMTFTVNQPQQ